MDQEIIVMYLCISVPGGGKNQQNLSELGPVPRGLSPLQELRVI